jgi:uncharacterized membrane protein YdbT with pleckstrin-like domain
MSYVESVLQPGERVITATRPHWFLYVPAIVLALLAIAIEIWATRLETTNSLIVLLCRIILPALFAGAAIVAWVPAFVRRATTELAATDKRIIYKTGLLKRHTIEMNMEKVESVNVDQSILGRIFGYGTVTIHGTGGSLEPLRAIAEPLAFRNCVTAA